MTSGRSDKLRAGQSAGASRCCRCKPAHPHGAGYGPCSDQSRQLSDCVPHMQPGRRGAVSRPSVCRRHPGTRSSPLATRGRPQTSFSRRQPPPEYSERSQKLVWAHPGLPLFRWSLHPTLLSIWHKQACDQCFLTTTSLTSKDHFDSITPREVHEKILSFGRGGRAVSPLASHQGEPGSIPGQITGFSHVVIVPDDAVGRQVFSGISPTILFRHCSTLKSLHSDTTPLTRRNKRRRREKRQNRRATSSVHPPSLACAGLRDQLRCYDLRRNSAAVCTRQLPWRR
ncbi:hypothetical protein PR048_011667 [Dryococelus australis]|uniref:Uncharacterized protein n=1 Tax=Dryococelus australis TaxID=614101 RepID=A0ABQ9HME9_9NEOP|nr:hypothetical protein PR048_011667 [Dryococelus australis]